MAKTPKTPKSKKQQGLTAEELSVLGPAAKAQIEKQLKEQFEKEIAAEIAAAESIKAAADEIQSHVDQSRTPSTEALPPVAKSNGSIFMDMSKQFFANKFKNDFPTLNKMMDRYEKIKQIEKDDKSDDGQLIEEGNERLSGVQSRLDTTNVKLDEVINAQKDTQKKITDLTKALNAMRDGQGTNDLSTPNPNLPDKKSKPSGKPSSGPKPSSMKMPDPASLARGAKGVLGGGLVAYGADAIAGEFGVGQEAIDKEADDANWKKMNWWQTIESGIGRGIEHVGDFVAPNIANQARSSRIKSESEYFNKQDAAAVSKPAPIGDSKLEQQQRATEEASKDKIREVKADKITYLVDLTRFKGDVIIDGDLVVTGDTFKTEAERFNKKQGEQAKKLGIEPSTAPPAGGDTRDRLSGAGTGSATADNGGGGNTGSGGDVDRVLSTIRKRESGGNYQIKSQASSASGAYQFIDSTWQSLASKYGYANYKRAADAPPEVQDAVARAYIKEILAANNGDVSKIPLVWYTGNAQGKISQKALAINGGMTPAQYQAKWMSDYNGAGGGQQQGGQQVAGAANKSPDLSQAGAASDAGMLGGAPPPIASTLPGSASQGGARTAGGPLGGAEPPAGENGKLDTSSLTSIGGSHKLQGAAAQAYKSMVEAAAQQKISWGITDSYRDYNTQVRLVREKGLYSQGGLAAAPGTSNHGWGLATDLDLDAKSQAWLQQNASTYGFSTIPREPWHWEYKGEGAVKGQNAFASAGGGRMAGGEGAAGGGGALREFINPSIEAAMNSGRSGMGARGGMGPLSPFGGGGASPFGGGGGGGILGAIAGGLIGGALGGRSGAAMGAGAGMGGGLAMAGGMIGGRLGGRAGGVLGAIAGGVIQSMAGNGVGSALNRTGTSMAASRPPFRAIPVGREAGGERGNNPLPRDGSMGNDPTVVGNVEPLDADSRYRELFGVV